MGETRNVARVDVSIASDAEPTTAWKLASDLRRFDEWMTIFGGWRGPVPSTIEKGTRVSSCVKVKGFRKVVHWKVTGYDETKSIELQGYGRGGIRIVVSMEVAAGPPGSEFHLTADLGGGLLSGPIGSLVAWVIRSDVRKSMDNIDNLASLQ